MMISSSPVTFGSLVSGEALRDDDPRGSSTAVFSESDPRDSNTSQVAFINSNENIPSEDTVGREYLATTEVIVSSSAFVDARGAEDASSRETGGFCFWVERFARGFGILDTNSPS